MARYSEEHRRSGELTSPEAARILGITSTTLNQWAHAAILGEPSRLSVEWFRRDVVGRYWFSKEAIEHLAKESIQ